MTELFWSGLCCLLLRLWVLLTMVQGDSFANAFSSSFGKKERERRRGGGGYYGSRGRVKTRGSVLKGSLLGLSDFVHTRFGACVSGCFFVLDFLVLLKLTLFLKIFSFLGVSERKVQKRRKNCFFF